MLQAKGLVSVEEFYDVYRPLLGAFWPDGIWLDGVGDGGPFPGLGVCAVSQCLSCVVLRISPFDRLRGVREQNFTARILRITRARARAHTGPRLPIIMLHLVDGLCTSALIRTPCAVPRPGARQMERTQCRAKHHVCGV